jgi:hypothetical protein
LAKIYLFHDAILFHCCSITAAQSHWCQQTLIR